MHIRFQVALYFKNSIWLVGSVMADIFVVFGDPMQPFLS